MNAEVKRKWVEALRGGKYSQSDSVLRRHDDGYCCLGVLCDVIEPEKWVIGTGHRSYTHDDGICWPSLRILEVAGLPFTSPYAKNTLEHLAKMNDDGASFQEIAAHIEQNL